MSQAAFLNEYSSDRYREARIPIDDVDASVADPAVKALLPDCERLFRTLQCIYPQALA